MEWSTRKLGKELGNYEEQFLKDLEGVGIAENMLEYIKNEIMYELTGISTRWGCTIFYIENKLTGTIGAYLSDGILLWAQKGFE